MTATAQLYRITTVSEARREGEHQSQKRKNKERENHLNNSLTTNQFQKKKKITDDTREASFAFEPLTKTTIAIAIAIAIAITGATNNTGTYSRRKIG